MIGQSPQDLAVKDSLPVDYSFEIEFMVAQELTGSLRSSDHYTPYCLPLQRPWACPAEEMDPSTVIVHKCKDLLREVRESVAICEDPSAGDSMVQYFCDEDGPPMDLRRHWFVEPSVNTSSRRHSPQSYEWYGVRLCSPTYRDQDLMDKVPPVSWILGLLRRGLLIHVNSTCRFKVHVKPTESPLSLFTAKKLTTLVWVLEKELLERVCPNSYGLPYHHVNTLESSSRIASHVWYGSGERSRRQDPLRIAISALHLPPLHNMDLLTRLELVWDACSTEELAKGLLQTTGRPASFAVHAGENHAHGSSFEFGYALWHPYADLDASQYWIELSIRLLQATMRNAERFKQYLSQLDDLIHGFTVNSSSPTHRWKTLLSTLGLTDESSDSWGAIIEAYRSGHRLTRPWIDKQGFLS